ncbi:hypothetical protein EYF80_038736 [Liparis tanakae]|uniref:Uncharacterized protein n=1 Tax=Liparis tanakae TaxID=230148 RepID=A0A4Z2GD47_9TELE|nr:hypothetical protein EYF80_038736 [Liparis tanakae]
MSPGRESGLPIQLIELPAWTNNHITACANKTYVSPGFTSHLQRSSRRQKLCWWRQLGCRPSISWNEQEGTMVFRLLSPHRLSVHGQKRTPRLYSSGTRSRKRRRPRWHLC